VKGGAAPQALAFEIQDTGVGIPAEEHDHIFDAFVQSARGHQAAQGTGLGLAISHHFVSLMGGELSVDSQVGQGSTFRFEIPLAPVKALVVEPTPTPSRRVLGLAPGQSAPDGGPYRLLVVEDDPTNQRLMTHLLQSWGPELAVRLAENGAEAVEIWQAWRPHLIWMDMRMPVMNGYEATRRIRAASNAEPPGTSVRPVIIAVTASAFEEERAHILSEGCDDMVRKPYHEIDICDKLSRYLGLGFATASEASVGTPASKPAEQAATVVTAPERADERGAISLAGVPEEWVIAFRRATIEGDLAQMLKLVGQIQGRYPAAASQLLDWVQSFQHKKILELLTPRSPRVNDGRSDSVIPPPRPAGTD